MLLEIDLDPEIGSAIVQAYSENFGTGQSRLSQNTYTGIDGQTFKYAVQTLISLQFSQRICSMSYSGTRKVLGFFSLFYY